jgi:K+-sensing histidine kinase KdpD
MTVAIMSSNGRAMRRLRQVMSAMADGSGAALLGRMLQALALVGMITGVLLSASGMVRLEHVSIVYLVPVLIAATCWGTFPAVVSAMAGIAASAFFFYPPLYDLRVSNPQHIVDLCLFISVAIVTSQLAERTRIHIRATEEREEEMRGLYAFSRRLAVASTAQDILSAVRDHLSHRIGHRVFLVGHPAEAGTPAYAADVAHVPDAVRSHISQRPQGAAGTCCVDHRTGSTWLVGALSASNSRGHGRVDPTAHRRRPYRRRGDAGAPRPRPRAPPGQYQGQPRCLSGGADRFRLARAAHAPVRHHGRGIGAVADQPDRPG